jgi:hypothetical protein
VTRTLLTYRGHRPTTPQIHPIQLSIAIAIAIAAVATRHRAPRHAESNLDGGHDDGVWLGAAIWSQQRPTAEPRFGSRWHQFDHDAFDGNGAFALWTHRGVQRKTGVFPVVVDCVAGSGGGGDAPPPTFARPTNTAYVYAAGGVCTMCGHVDPTDIYADPSGENVPPMTLLRDFTTAKLWMSVADEDEVRSGCQF